MIKALFTLAVLTLATAARAQDASTLIDQGYEKQKAGNLDGAIADFDKAIQLAPDEPRGYFFRADAKYHKPDYDGAIADLNKAIKLKPGYEIAYVSRGHCELSQRKFDAAIADFDRAIRLNPNDYFPYADRASAKSEKGDLGGAMADYGLAIQARPDSPFAYAGRGQVRITQRDFDGAIADLTKAVELKSDDTFAYSHRAIARRELGDFDGAMADCNQVIAIDPRDAWGYEARGRLFYDQQKWKDALPDFRKRAELAPDDDYAHIDILVDRLRLGEKGAMEEFKQFVKSRKPKTADDWPGKLDAYLIGDLSQAELLTAAENPDKSKDNQQQCEAWFYIGTKVLTDGDKAAAREDFEKCVATDVTDFIEYESAVAELKHMEK